MKVTIIQNKKVTSVTEEQLKYTKVKTKQKPYTGFAEEMNIEDYQRVGH